MEFGNHKLQFDTATELIINSDAITIAQANHKLQPQTGTSDNLSTISGTRDGDFGVLYVSDFGTDTITIKHNVGNIICMAGADISLSNGCVMWYSNGTKVFVAGGGGGGGTAWGAITGTITDQTDLINRYDFWKPVAGSPARASNTTFTVTGDYTSLIKKGMIIWWKESSSSKFGMVSIPSTYGAPNTTVTIIGDAMAATPDAGSAKYCTREPLMLLLQKSGTIGAVETNAFTTFPANMPYKVFGCDPWVGFTGTTNSTTFDVNKDTGGGATTMFTTKPTLGSGVQKSATPFSADDGATLALGDIITGDVDAIQTTPAADGYILLYVMPSKWEYYT